MQFVQHGNVTRRLVHVLVLMISLAFTAPGQSVPYPQIFGTDWDKARRFAEENQDWMRESCTLFHVDYFLAVSVVFPELIRYTALRDKMEITLMKALYVHKGTEYADFSIGVFQMKPSCAESILTEILKNGERKFSRYFGKLHRALSGRENRAVILKELEDPEAQFIYVLAMIRLLDNTYGKKSWYDQEEKVRFYAAAYNSGFKAPENRIKEHMNAAFFHTGLGKPSVCYSYSAIAAAFYHAVAAEL